VPEPAAGERAGHRRTWALVGMIAAATLLAAGCSKGSGGAKDRAQAPANAAADQAPAEQPAAAPVTITFLNLAIDRTTENVPVGTKVVWKNAETNGVPHNVTSGTVQGTTSQPDGTFASTPLFNPGESYEHTFTAAGTYRYFCSVHPVQMQGTITVG
jgi:plastocyanin